jgi:hypothetical protein
MFFAKESIPRIGQSVTVEAWVHSQGSPRVACSGRRVRLLSIDATRTACTIPRCRWNVFFLATVDAQIGRSLGREVRIGPRESFPEDRRASVPVATNMTPC